MLHDHVRPADLDHDPSYLSGPRTLILLGREPCPAPISQHLQQSWFFTLQAVPLVPAAAETIWIVESDETDPTVEILIEIPRPVINPFRNKAIFKLTFSDPPPEPPAELARDGTLPQLIYYALMGCKDHRMSIDELYQWFKLYTTRAKSTSGEWRYPIRATCRNNEVSPPLRILPLLTLPNHTRC